MTESYDFDHPGELKHAAATEAVGARTLRIAHLTPTYFSAESVVGGGERYVLNLAQALKTTEESNSLRYSFRQTILSLGSAAKLLMQGGIPIRVFLNDNPSADPMSGMSELLWRELADYDLIHVHQSLTVFGAYCSIIAKTLRKPLILTDLGGGYNPVMSTGKGLELADGVISISSFAHSFIAPYFSGPYEVVIGPVDTDFFDIGASADAGPPVAICVSRILPHKGIDRIIKALPPGLKLRVVGRIYDQAYYALLKQMSVGKDVEFIHDADDKKLLSLYQSSDLFLQGSTVKDCNGNIVPKPELMGLTTLEAIACGLPVIVSDGGALPELIPDADYGRVFSTHDELRGYLDDFMRGRWPERADPQEAHSHVVNHYSYKTVGARLGRFYTFIYNGDNT
jgi:glycosyltransferase involved in cell wall biosynthesis